MLKISCESILPLFSRPQNNHQLHAFSLTGKVKMATYSSSIPECCVPEVKVSLTGSSLFRRRVRETDVSLETIIFFSYPHMSALNLCDADYSGSSQVRPINC